MSESYITVPNEHNHLPEPQKIDAKKLLNSMKERATTTMEKLRQIVLQSCKNSHSSRFAFVREKRQETLYCLVAPSLRAAFEHSTFKTRNLNIGLLKYK